MNSTPSWLAFAAQRCSKHPNLLGYVLESYRQRKCLSPEALASELRCTPQALQWLALCLRPLPEDIDTDIPETAARFQAHEPTLRSIVREAEHIEPARPEHLPNQPIDKWTRHRKAVGLALASVVFFVGFIGVAIQQRTRHTSSPVVLTTDVGEQLTYILPDQSTVVLNTDSRLQVYFGAHKRHLRLEKGEARFIVAQDHKRPFSVDTPNASITDIGTTFNVYVSGQGTNVSVLQGRVILSPTAAPTMSLALDADQQGEVTPTGALLSGGSRPLLHAKEWLKHRLVFKGEPAAEIVSEISRYYKQRIRIVDPRLAGERLTTVLPSNNFADLKRALESHPHIDVTADDDGDLLLHWHP
jgi:transmembrane sensor